MSTIDTIRRSRVSFMERATRIIGEIDLRLQRQKSRRDLLGLDDDQLKDLGLSRADAWKEGGRSIWD